MRSSIAILQQEAQRRGASATTVQTLTQIMAAESGGDPNARNTRSSAAGLFQFIDRTWAAMDRQSEEITAAGRMDARQQCIAALLYMRQNEVYLRRELGREPSAGDLYLAHFLGPAGAKNALRHGNSEHLRDFLSAGVMSANAGAHLPGPPRKNFRDFTVADLRAWADQKMGADIAGATVYNEEFAERRQGGQTGLTDGDRQEIERRRRQLRELGFTDDQINEISPDNMLGIVFIGMLLQAFGQMHQTPETEQGIDLQRNAASAASPSSPRLSAAPADVRDVGDLPSPDRPIKVAQRAPQEIRQQA